MRETNTLYELNEFVRRTITLNLPDPIWISCEIFQISESRGHHYITLVQKEETSEKILAQAEAVLWQRQSRKLRRNIGSVFNSVLTAGTAVRLQVKIDFHERYGYKLQIEDLDPAFTLGQIAMIRNRNLEQLREESLLNTNSGQHLPQVLQKIAVISAQQAAGLKDFLHQIENNPYNYQIYLRFYEAAVQGEKLEEEIIKALKQIKALKHRYQAVVIIRGGGSKLDLSGFDNFNLCKTIAQFPLPVITGIGHESDESLADLVAHTALKTPTAAAEFILHRNLQFENSLVNYWQKISQFSRQHIKLQTIRLEKMVDAVQLFSSQLIKEEKSSMDRYAHSIPLFSEVQLEKHRQQLDKNEELIKLLHPEATLKRGYSLTSINGQAVQSVKKLKKGDRISTRFSNGSINSIVE